MKRRIAALVAASFFAMAGAASAFYVQSGAIGIKYNDITFADFDYSTYNAGALEKNPLQGATQSGNVWGIFSMTTVHSLLDQNPENNLFDVAHYSAGDDGKYYLGVYGGVTLQSITPASGVPPFQARLAETQEGSYLKVYEFTGAAAATQAWNKAYQAGANVPSAGSFGTFAKNIIYGVDGIMGNADDPTLFLDTVYSPYTLAAYDAAYQPGEVELVAQNTARTASTEAYLDIIGGTGAYYFKKGAFPLSPPPQWYLDMFGESGLTVANLAADLKVISDLTALYNPLKPTGQKWTDPYLWTTSSQDPITGIVTPEPSTIVLLGLGMIGIAGFGYRRSRA